MVGVYYIIYMVTIVLSIMMVYVLIIFLQWLSILYPHTMFSKWWRDNICDVTDEDI